MGTAQEITTKTNADNKSDDGKKTNSIKDVGIPIFTSVAATLITLLIVYLASQTFSDERAIRDVIDQEAIYAQNHDISKVMSLYADDAILRDAAGGNRNNEIVWHGKDRIEDRYKNLADFTYLSHEMIDISLCSDGSYARANSDTVGEYVVDGKVISITNDRSEQWEFKKIDGNWKIAYFTYNLP